MSNRTTRRRWPWIVLGGIAVIAFIAIGTSGTKPSAPSSPADAPDQAVQTGSGVYGASLNAGDMAVLVTPPQKHTEEYLGSQYCSTVSLRNNGNTQLSYNEFDFKFRSSAGAESGPGVAYGDSSTGLNSGELVPGGTIQGTVCSDDTVKNVAAVVYSPGFGIEHQLTWHP